MSEGEANLKLVRQQTDDKNDQWPKKGFFRRTDDASSQVITHLFGKIDSFRQPWCQEVIFVWMMGMDVLVMSIPDRLDARELPFSDRAPLVHGLESLDHRSHFISERVVSQGPAWKRYIAREEWGDVLE